MMRHFFWVYGLSFLTTLTLVSPASARPWIYEPDRSGELRRMQEEFHDLYESKGRFQELRDAYLQYARDHEGTSNGGDALLGAANITVIYLADLPGARVLFQEAVDKYPGSRIAIGARSNLAGWERRFDGATVHLAKMSEIAVDFGGPSVEEVLAASDTSALTAQMRRLHPEIQLCLSHIYEGVFYELKHLDFDQAFAIAEFGRSALEPAALPGKNDYSRIITRLISERYNPPGNITSIPSTPQVTILSPLPNSTVGPNPNLQLRVTTGNYHMTRVDLTRLEFEVDGVDRRFEVVVKNDLDLSFQENVNFETLTLSLPTDLGPGVHTATVKVRRAKIAADQELPQPVEVTWSFTVDPNHSSQPTSVTLPATKDAIIDNFDPNGNEGANGILALDKLLGRSSRSLVAFDLSNVDTNRLTKATLALSIHKEEKIFGCGQGENVSVQALTHSWLEGNGKTYKVFPLTQRRRGSGSGATWNRDTDTNIANLVPNGGTAWKGAQSATMPRTAPLVIARDHMEGTLQFDVTDDVFNGAPHGWLVRKQHENLASRISFYSKEGATTKGDPNLGPRLILEYGEPTAQTELEKLGQAVAFFLGVQLEQPMALQPQVTPLESSKHWRDVLQESPRAAFLVEQAVTGLAGQNPLSQLGAQLAYRSWLRGELSLV